MLSNLKKNFGLSLIEVLLTVSILVFILSIGLFVNFNFFESNNFLSEEKILETLLKTTRNRALSNKNQIPHGLFVGEVSFVIFEGQTFEESSESNEYFPRNKIIEIESNFSNSQIIWNNLSASPSQEGEFRVFDNERESKIKINLVGGIEIND